MRENKSQRERTKSDDVWIDKICKSLKMRRISIGDHKLPRVCDCATTFLISWPNRFLTGSQSIFAKCSRMISAQRFRQLVKCCCFFVLWNSFIKFFLKKRITYEKLRLDWTWVLVRRGSEYERKKKWTFYLRTNSVPIFLLTKGEFFFPSCNTFSQNQVWADRLSIANPSNFNSQA